MRKILLIATTRLCKDGLTEVLLRIAETLREDETGIALAEGCDPSVEKALPCYLVSLRNLIARKRYEVVHIHGNSASPLC